MNFDDVQEVPALESRYRFVNGKMVFEDGVEYTLAEALLMQADRNLNNVDMLAIHLVKKLFDGEIIYANGYCDVDTMELKECRDVETPGRDVTCNVRTDEMQEAIDGEDPLADLEAEFGKDLPFLDINE